MFIVDTHELLPQMIHYIIVSSKYAYAPLVLGWLDPVSAVSSYDGLLSAM